MTIKRDFYTPILNELKNTTNLTNISKKLSISKQVLNYYLRKLKEKGFVTQKSKGWYELTNSKNSTKYGNLLPKDFIRGHAYIWNIKLTRKIENWEKRIEILKSKGINYNLVGALKDIPRIKVLGRKVWLCKDHLRIFDIKNSSYYGQTSIESRYRALNEVFLIVGALESKLGVFLRPVEINWQKEHYALIKNDLAIDQNRKGIIWRVSDEQGEWLLIDDSLEQGGELENVGKSSFQVNPKMQKWWNEQKETDFKVTPSFLMETLAIQQNQLNQFTEQIKSHLALISEYRKENKAWRKSEVKKIKSDLINGTQKTLGEY